jgi:hypothetical protein
MLSRGRLCGSGMGEDHMHFPYVLRHLLDGPSFWVASAGAVAIGGIIASDRRQLVRILLLFLVFGLLLASVPLLIILLISNGAINVLDLRWSNGWADQLALAFDFLIPVFLVVLPQLIRRRMKWSECAAAGEGAPNLQALLPTWLAALAAASTAALISTLHFAKGGQLSHQHPAVVVAGSIGIMLLLMPIYSLLARANWERKLYEVFNPLRWTREQRAAWTAMWQILLRTHPADPAAAVPPVTEPAPVGAQLATPPAGL